MKIVNKKIEIIEINQNSQYILTFLIYFKQFRYKLDLFPSISNFSTKSGLVLIDFVAMIDFDSKKLDQKSQLKGD